MQDWVGIPYLISEDVIDGLARGRGTHLDRFLEPHVRSLRRAFKTGAHFEGVLVATSSLAARVERFRGRKSRSLARLFGLEASLLLAAGSVREDARRAFDRATEAVAIASRFDDTDALAFIAEYEMVAAVALKAAGDVDESIAFTRTAGMRLGSYPLAIPLVRQEVLMLQDRREFGRLLDRASEYRSSNPREYYRTIKRALEFNLNLGAIDAAHGLLGEFVWGFYASRARMGLLDHVSWLKNIGQLLGARGEFRRALAVLDLAGALAQAGSLTGQRRQIASLQSAFADGQRDARLVSFELAS